MSKNKKYIVPATHTYTPRSPGLNQKYQVFEDKSKRLPGNQIDWCDECLELLEDCLCDYDEHEQLDPDEDYIP